MASLSSYSAKGALTLSNSIIGVSILAMPFCMKSCGLVLGTMLLIGSALLTRFTCHLLLKSAALSRRKTFELIALQSFGSIGKLLAELNIIGFLLGLLISFFVVFGDLGTLIISQMLNLEYSDTLRTVTLIVLGFGVALPLAMLKELDVLSKISTLSIIFYVVLALKIFLEALPVLLTDNWKTKVTLWEPSGVLKCLPIFALALSCQTQIFTICDSLPDPSLKTMNSVIKLAVYLCTALYIIVGLFGYIGGCEKIISGNILVSLTPGFFTELIKLCFVLSVALSFPLIVLPCRTSIHSLLFRKATGPFDVGISLMSETRFKGITFAIIFFTFTVGLLCPNIEMVLGFIGSTIGVLICIIFPALMFVRLSPKTTVEKRTAQGVLFVGFLLLLTCTWMHFQTVNPYSTVEESINAIEEIPHDLIVDNTLLKEQSANSEQLSLLPEAIQQLRDSNTVTRESKTILRSDYNTDLKDIGRQHLVVESLHKSKQLIEIDLINKQTSENIIKEREVLQKLENDEKKAVLQQVEIIKKLEAHQEAEKKILEERRQLLAEILNHKKNHDSGNEHIDVAEKSKLNKTSKDVPVLTVKPNIEVLATKTQKMSKKEDVEIKPNTDSHTTQKITMLKKVENMLNVIDSTQVNDTLPSEKVSDKIIDKAHDLNPKSISTKVNKIVAVHNETIKVNEIKVVDAAEVQNIGRDLKSFS